MSGRVPEPAAGLLVVDKPGGWTSHDVVGRVRRLAGTRRVGHAGTLDPMATGVLLVGVGRATRLLGHLAGAGKAYDATVRLGVSTLTDDAEGEETGRVDASTVTEQALADAVAALRGEIRQVPSKVSAIKVAGRRSYARVRAGEEVELAARPVTVHRLSVLGVRRDAEHGVVDVDVRVECSAGTYVRAIARDLGASLGVGGHLTMLRRTRVGDFDVSEARTLDELAADCTPLPMPVVARRAFPVVTVDANVATAVGYGRKLPAAVLAAADAEPDRAAAGGASDGAPVAGGPVAGEPVVAESVAGESVAGESVAGEPGAGEPGAREPGAGEPVASAEPANPVALFGPDGRFLALYRQRDEQAVPVAVFV